MRKVLALMLLLAVGLSFADIGVFGSIQQGSALWVIFPAILLLVVMILVAMTMLSTALSMPQLEAWAKVEIRELISSVIIIIFVMAAVGGTDLAAARLLSSFSTGAEGVGGCEKDSTLSAYAVCLVNNMIAPLDGAYQDAIKVSHYISLISGYSFTYPVSMYVFSFSYMEAPYSAYGSLLSALYQAAGALVNAILTYNTIILFLGFFAFASLQLLPLAFALRVIPFTRSVGTTLIALCIAGYVIFPFSVVLVSEMHDVVVDKTGLLDNIRLSDSVFSKMKLHIPGNFDDVCKGWIKDFASLPGEAWGVAICTPLCLAQLFAYAECWLTCWNYVAGVFYPTAVNYGQTIYGFMFLMSNLTMQSAGGIGAIYQSLYPYYSAINNAVMLSYAEVIVISTLTYVGAKSVSSALGGEYYLPGMQRLI